MTPAERQEIRELIREELQAFDERNALVIAGGFRREKSDRLPDRVELGSNPTSEQVAFPVDGSDSVVPGAVQSDDVVAQAHESSPSVQGEVLVTPSSPDRTVGESGDTADTSPSTVSPLPTEPEPEDQP